MLCLSYFANDFFWLLREDKQTDFINMLLHHICTISLIVFSHLVNYSNVGSIVLILHMESDIFVHSTRFLLQTDFPEFIKKWNLFKGNIATEFMKSIGDNIDMVLIDTAHFEPGEIMDFLMGLI